MTHGKMMSVPTLCVALWLSACSTASDSTSGSGRDDRTMAGAVETGDSPTMTRSGEELRRLLVHHHMAECFGLQPQLCLLVRESEQDEWAFMYDDIEGFEYRWGHSYDLGVAVRDVPNPPADGSSLAYRLIDTVSETATDRRMPFDFPSRWAPELIARDSTEHFLLGQQRRFRCMPAECETLASLLEQRFSVLLQFRHPADPADPLELVQIGCSDAEQSFRESCLP